MNVGITNFKGVNLSDYFKLHAQEKFFSDEDPLKLIDLFESAMTPENNNSSANCAYLNDFIKKFKILTQKNSALINERIIYIYGLIYFSVFDNNS